MFVTVSNFHPSLIFTLKARSLPLEWSSFILLHLVGSDHARKYEIRVEVTDSDKHSSLLRCVINYSREKFYNVGPLVLLNWNEKDKN